MKLARFKQREGADEPVAESPVVELEFGPRRVVLVQRMGDAIRITTAHREERSVTPALVIGGSVFLSVDHLPVLLQTVRKVARRKRKPRKRP